jgi:hypothetical protein
MSPKYFEEDQKWKNEFKKWEIKDASWKRKVEQDTSKISFLFVDLVSRDSVKSKGSDFARKFKLRNLAVWFGCWLTKKFLH